MKKILILATSVLLLSGAAFASPNCGKDKKCCKDKKETKKDGKSEKEKSTSTAKA